MKFMSIDPSSTNLGWAVFDDGGLISYGVISTDAVPYEMRYLHICQELSALYACHDFTEVACERAIRFEGRRIPALEVAVTSIKKWAERQRRQGHPGFIIYFYSPSEWKVSAAGSGSATKEEVARVICLEYKQLRADVSDHITDAIGIGIHHRAVRRLEELSAQAD